MARPLVTPWKFAEALQAAGIIDNSDRITEILIRAKPGEPVAIEVTYLADDRIYGLVKPGG